MRRTLKQSRTVADSEGPFNHALKPARRSRRRATVKFAATVLIAIVGLAAGWIGGKALSTGPTPPPVPDPTEVESAVGPSELQSVSPREKSPGPTNVAPLVEPKSENDPRVAQPEPHKVPQVDKDEGAADKTVDEIPNEEQSTEEIGRKALKKMMKEIDKMKNGNRRGKNQNVNESGDN